MRDIKTTIQCGTIISSEAIVSSETNATENRRRLNSNLFKEADYKKFKIISQAFDAEKSVGIDIALTGADKGIKIFTAQEVPIDDWAYEDILSNLIKTRA